VLLHRVRFGIPLLLRRVDLRKLICRIAEIIRPADASGSRAWPALFLNKKYSVFVPLYRIECSKENHLIAPIGQMTVYGASRPLPCVPAKVA
jgi:hypothetical protein